MYLHRYLPMRQRHSPIPIRTSFVVDVAARSNQYVKPFYWKIQVNINFTSHVWHFLKLMSPSSSCVRLSRWVNRVLQFYNDCKVVHSRQPVALGSSSSKEEKKNFLFQLCQELGSFSLSAARDILKVETF